MFPLPPSMRSTVSSRGKQQRPQTSAVHFACLVRHMPWAFCVPGTVLLGASRHAATHTSTRLALPSLGSFWDAVYRWFLGCLWFLLEYAHVLTAVIPTVLDRPGGPLFMRYLKAASLGWRCRRMWQVWARRDMGSRLDQGAVFHTWASEFARLGCDARGTRQRIYASNPESRPFRDDA
jgi:hypothetical protein